MGSFRLPTQHRAIPAEVLKRDIGQYVYTFTVAGVVQIGGEPYKTRRAARKACLEACAAYNAKVKAAMGLMGSRVRGL